MTIASVAVVVALSLWGCLERDMRDEWDLHRLTYSTRAHLIYQW
jgi:hypothetical protein